MPRILTQESISGPKGCMQSWNTFRKKTNLSRYVPALDLYKRTKASVARSKNYMHMAHARHLANEEAIQMKSQNHTSISHTQYVIIPKRAMVKISTRVNDWFGFEWIWLTSVRNLTAAVGWPLRSRYKQDVNQLVNHRIVIRLYACRGAATLQKLGGPNRAKPGSVFRPDFERGGSRWGSVNSRGGGVVDGVFRPDFEGGG